MAMNIPAPVQILRYEIPEGSTVNDVYEYVYNNIKEGMMLLIVGDVLSNNLSREVNEKFTTVMFAIGVKYGDVVSPVFIPMIMYGTGIDENYIYTDVGSNLFTFSVSDVIPSNANNNYNDSSMSSRGLIVGPTYKTNIDTVHEYGIYWPDADSTLPEEVKSRNNLVLHYSSSGRFPTNIQILLSSMGFGTSNPVLIYTRQSGSFHPSGPEDWSPWQPFGGGSSLTAGDGISITDDAVAVDDTVVRTNKSLQSINGSLRIADGDTGGLTVSSGSNVYSKHIPTSIRFYLDSNGQTYGGVSATKVSTDSSPVALLEAYATSTANASVKVVASENGGYATAPSTRSTPVDNEIITYDFLSTRYLPISGGTLTGGLFGTSVALSGDSIDISQGSCFTKTITAATTFVFTGVPSNATACFSLVLTNGGSQTVTWPSSVKWSGGANPELASSGVDVFTFLTADGGTTWYGVHSVQGAA